MPALPALITVVAGELITASDANYNWSLLHAALTQFDISNLSGSITAAQHGDLSTTTSRMHDDLSIKYSGSLVGVTTVHGALIGIIQEIWGLSAAISGFSSSIGALSGSVSALSGSVGALSASVTSISASISRIDALSGSLGQLITDVQALSAAVHAMSGSMGGGGGFANARFTQAWVGVSPTTMTLDVSAGVATTGIRVQAMVGTPAGVTGTRSCSIYFGPNHSSYIGSVPLISWATTYYGSERHEDTNIYHVTAANILNDYGLVWNPATDVIRVRTAANGTLNGFSYIEAVPY